MIPREGSIGLIAPDALVPALGEALTAAGIGYALLGAEETAETEFEQHLDLVPASLAKGLEFDHVVLAEPAAIVAGEPDRVTGLRRLYVCLTRAVTSLVVLHKVATSGGARWLNGAVDLGDRWPLAGCDGLRDELVSAYAAPTRGYHDTRHLTEVLDRLDELSAAGVAFDERDGAAGGVVPRRRLRRPALGRGAQRGLGRARAARHRARGRRGRRGGPAGPAHRDPPAGGPRRRRLRALRRRPRDPRGPRRPLCRVRRRGPPRVLPRPRRARSARAGPTSSATCSPSPTCSTRRTPASTGRRPPAPTSNASSSR